MDIWPWWLDCSNTTRGRGNVFPCTRVPISTRPFAGAPPIVVMMYPWLVQLVTSAAYKLVKHDRFAGIEISFGGSHEKCHRFDDFGSIGNCPGPACRDRAGVWPPKN